MVNGTGWPVMEIKFNSNVNNPLKKLWHSMTLHAIAFVKQTSCNEFMIHHHTTVTVRTHVTKLYHITSCKLFVCEP
jgi:hypothetical protein